MPASLAGRIVLVTGAGHGIGAAVARACAAEGASLVLTARSRAALEEVDDQVRAAGAEPATLVPLDLAKGSEVDLLGAALFQRFGRLDGLAACAGDIGLLTPVSHLDPAVMARVLLVNVAANQRLVRTLDPLLRVSPAGRAVFATDATGRCAAYWGAYGACKAALESLVLSWAAELRITPVRVTLLDPGPVATRLRATAFPGERPDSLRQPDDVAGGFVELLRASSARHEEIVRLQP
ncbi:MAG TPA: SDR family NAD(P)-dependent oxidoreductase [Geminicoccaceae bacterium]|nr:SDR family NAD(P)-dependent oxidoreductase [Geminicoccus sp.]HMU49554.1 SDR family NAD(P)-dependent oxidoreductase [Geminicoccaceae bacterium]